MNIFPIKSFSSTGFICNLENHRICYEGLKFGQGISMASAIISRFSKVVNSYEKSIEGFITALKAVLAF